MTASETLKLIAKQWCSLSVLMKLAGVGRNNALYIVGIKRAVTWLRNYAEGRSYEQGASSDCCRYIIWCS